MFHVKQFLSCWCDNNDIKSSIISLKIDVYINLLLKEKNVRNIIGTDSRELLIKKHIIPSLNLGLIISGKTGVDIGSGNGLPGFIIALLYPEKQITLMDSKRSRINFLEKVKRETAVKNIILFHERAEIAGRKKAVREKYDFATSRAVGNLKTTVELALPLLKKGGRFYAERGHNADTQVKETNEFIISLGGKVEKIIKNDIIVIVKKSTTPMMYPRNWRQIMRA